MNNTVVVYESVYGSTKKYAEWLKEDLQCDLFCTKDIDGDKLGNYDTIIYGGGLYAGGISGIKLIIDNYEKLKTKNIAVFTVGLSDVTNKENIDNIHSSIEKVFSKEMIDNISFFHLRGGIDYNKLTLTHKLMMGMLKHMLKKKKPSELSDENKEFLDTYGSAVDFVNRDSIKPIVEFAQRKE